MRRGHVSYIIQSIVIIKWLSLKINAATMTLFVRTNSIYECSGRILHTHHDAIHIPYILGRPELQKLSQSSIFPVILGAKSKKLDTFLIFFVKNQR